MMHRANLKHSKRLQSILLFLRKRGKEGATTHDIAHWTGVCAVSTAISEIRNGGIPVHCEYECTTEQGCKVYRYTVAR